MIPKIRRLIDIATPLWEVVRAGQAIYRGEIKPLDFDYRRAKLAQ